MIRVYLDPSYLVLGTQHNPSPPPLTLGSIYMELWDVSAVPSPVSLVKAWQVTNWKKIWAASSREGEPKIYMRKNCPTWKGYPTRHGKKTRPSESLALRDEFATFIWLVG